MNAEQRPSAMVTSNEEAVVNHQPLSNSIEIVTRWIENCSSLLENNDMTSVVLVRNPNNDYYAYTGNIFDIREYRVWSFFNLFFCFSMLGLYAVIMSCETSKKKRLGDHLSARNRSNITAFLNITCTLAGMLFYILAGLRLSGHLVVNRPPME